jgi:Flp pilus assembly protein TadD
MLNQLAISKLQYATIALTLTLAVCTANAADTGGSAPVSNTPTTEQRLSSARQAIKVNNWKLALTELNQAAKDEPKNAEVHNLLGYANRKQAQPNLAKAFEHYKLALELDPKHKGAHEYIGEAYLMDKKPEEAQKHLVLLEGICGNKTCEEYADLAKSLADYHAKNK